MFVQTNKKEDSYCVKEISLGFRGCASILLLRYFLKSVCRLDKAVNIHMTVPFPRPGKCEKHEFGYNRGIHT